MIEIRFFLRTVLAVLLVGAWNLPSAEALPLLCIKSGLNCPSTDLDDVSTLPDDFGAWELEHAELGALLDGYIEAVGRIEERGLDNLHNDDIGRNLSYSGAIRRYVFDRLGTDSYITALRYLDVRINDHIEEFPRLLYDLGQDLQNKWKKEFERSVGRAIELYRGDLIEDEAMRNALLFVASVAVIGTGVGIWRGGRLKRSWQSSREAMSALDDAARARNYDDYMDAVYRAEGLGGNAFTRAANPLRAGPHLPHEFQFIRSAGKGIGFLEGFVPASGFLATIFGSYAAGSYFGEWKANSQYREDFVFGIVPPPPAYYLTFGVTDVDDYDFEENPLIAGDLSQDEFWGRAWGLAGGLGTLVALRWVLRGKRGVQFARAILAGPGLLASAETGPGFLIVAGSLVLSFLMEFAIENTVESYLYERSFDELQADFEAGRARLREGVEEGRNLYILQGARDLVIAAKRMQGFLNMPVWGEILPRFQAQVAELKAEVFLQMRTAEMNRLRMEFYAVAKDAEGAGFQQALSDYEDQMVMLHKKYRIAGESMGVDLGDEDRVRSEYADLAEDETKRLVSVQRDEEYGRLDVMYAGGMPFSEYERRRESVRVSYDQGRRHYNELYPEVYEELISSSEFARDLREEAHAVAARNHLTGLRMLRDYAGGQARAWLERVYGGQNRRDLVDIQRMEGDPGERDRLTREVRDDYVTSREYKEARRRAEGDELAARRQVEGWSDALLAAEVSIMERALDQSDPRLEREAQAGVFELHSDALLNMGYQRGAQAIMEGYTTELMEHLASRPYDYGTERLLVRQSLMAGTVDYESIPSAKQYGDGLLAHFTEEYLPATRASIADTDVQLAFRSDDQAFLPGLAYADREHLVQFLGAQQEEDFGLLQERLERESEADEMTRSANHFLLMAVVELQSTGRDYLYHHVEDLHEVLSACTANVRTAYQVQSIYEHRGAAAGTRFFPMVEGG